MNDIDVSQESYHRCFGFNVEIWENLNSDHFDIRLFCLHHDCYLMIHWCKENTCVIVQTAKFQEPLQAWCLVIEDTVINTTNKADGSFS